MKIKVALIVFILVCCGLCLALIQRNKQAEEEHQKDLSTILHHSNQWAQANADLEEQKQVNLKYEKDLADRKADIVKLSNDLSQTSENLSKTEAALKSALEENAKRDAKIAALESQNEALDKQSQDLKGNINNLETQIADTQKKLAASEGDKAFLEKELKRLVAEKAELERQFNDLAVLRAQVHKLKEELSIARRLDWIRRGIFANSEQKGAEKLLQGANAPQLAKVDTNRYDLNVEVNADGTVKVIAPISTNAPPAGQPVQQ